MSKTGIYIGGGFVYKTSDLKGYKKEDKAPRKRKTKEEAANEAKLRWKVTKENEEAIRGGVLERYGEVKNIVPSFSLELKSRFRGPYKVLEDKLTSHIYIKHEHSFKKIGYAKYKSGYLTAAVSEPWKRRKNRKHDKSLKGWGEVLDKVNKEQKEVKRLDKEELSDLEEKKRKNREIFLASRIKK